MHAAAALEPLQDEDDAECQVITALLWLLKRDSSPDVRRSALNKIIVTNSTLPGVIQARVLNVFSLSFFPLPNRDAHC